MSDSSNGQHDQPNPDQGSGKSKRKRTAMRNVIDLLHGIKSGAIKPRSMTSSERQACVECLSDDGFGTAEIAKLLHYSPRQIARIRAKIRKDRRLSFDANRTAEVAGEVQAQLMAMIQRLRRNARDPQATVRDRLVAEKNVREALVSWFQSLQAMGFINRVFAKDAQRYESTIESVAKMLHEMERNNALRSADVRRRLKQLREQLEAEGIDIEGLFKDLEDEDEEQNPDAPG